MNKLYLTYNEKTKKRDYYSYKYESTPVYTKITSREIEAYLTKINKGTIKQIREINDTTLEVALDNNEIVIIDSIKIFEKQDSFDSLIAKFQNQIKTYFEKESIKEYKKSLPAGYRGVHVNRNRRDKAKMRLLIAGVSLSAIIILSTAANSQDFRSIKPLKSPPEDLELSYYIDEIKSIKREELNLNFDQTYEIPEIKSETEFALSFEDRTASGKLQETEEVCGEIIEYYTSRYGLPYEILCAQISQERGGFENVCQITYSLFAGEKPRHFKIPVYDENGFTGNYDEFTVTKEMLDTLEGNIMVGTAYLRFCVDKFDSLITGLFSYNQGEFALPLACNYYGVDIENYKGDENSLEARNLIIKYYQDKGKNHGDPLYLEHVFSYLPLETRGNREIEYYLGNGTKTIDLINTNVYNNDSERGQER